MSTLAQFRPLVVALLTATPDGLSAAELTHALRKGEDAFEFDKNDLMVALTQLENDSVLDSEIVLAPRRRRVYYLPKKGPRPFGRTVPAATTPIASIRPRTWASALGVDL